MGLNGKLVAEIEVNSSAENICHQFRYKPHHLSSFSKIVQDCELVDGEFGKPGSTIIWRYNSPAGKLYSAKEVVKFHEETKTVAFTVIEGDVLVDYKSFAITPESISREGQNDIVKFTIDYEKIKEDSPHPVESLDILINMAKEVETEHLTKPYVP